MKTKKHFGAIAAALFIVATLMGCAATPARGPHPPYLSSVNASSAKTGTASSTVIFGFGGTTYPTITEAARKGGITRIATVEYYKKAVFLSIVTEYITIVTGE